MNISFTIVFRRIEAWHGDGNRAEKNNEEKLSIVIWYCIYDINNRNAKRTTNEKKKKKKGN